MLLSSLAPGSHRTVVTGQLVLLSCSLLLSACSAHRPPAQRTESAPAPAAAPAAAPSAAPELPAAYRGADPEIQTRILQLLDRTRREPESPEAWADVGHRHRKGGLLESAAEAYRKAATFAPEDARWPYLLGHCLNQLERSEEAELAFREALRLAPDYAPAAFYLAREILPEGGEEADQLLAHATELAPTNSNIPLLRGQAAFLRGENQKALENYQLALARRPAHGDVLRSMALLFEKLGRQDLAAHAAKAAETLPAEAPFWDPWLDNPEPPLGVAARLDEAQRLSQLARYREAEDQLQAVLRFQPEHADAHRQLGVLFARREAFADAEAEYREAIRLAPSDPNMHAELVRFLIRQGRSVETLEPLSAIMALMPEAAAPRAAVARVLVELGDTEGAWQLVCDGISEALAAGEEAPPELLEQRDAWLGDGGPPGGCD